jgi:hypothetical protein
MGCNNFHRAVELATAMAKSWSVDETTKGVAVQALAGLMREIGPQAARHSGEVGDAGIYTAIRQLNRQGFHFIERNRPGAVA